jgi:hypothetical protein
LACFRRPRAGVGGEVGVISSAGLCRCRGRYAVGLWVAGDDEKRWALLDPFPSCRCCGDRHGRRKDRQSTRDCKIVSARARTSAPGPGRALAPPESRERRRVSSADLREGSGEHRRAARARGGIVNLGEFQCFALQLELVRPGPWALIRTGLVGEGDLGGVDRVLPAQDDLTPGQ